MVSEIRTMTRARERISVFLFAVVNILVVTTISVLLGLLRVGHYFPQGGLAGLAVVPEP